jgi:hypothetical protein
MICLFADLSLLARGIEPPLRFNPHKNSLRRRYARVEFPRECPNVLKPLSRLQQQPHGRDRNPAALPTLCHAHRIGFEI